MRPTRACGPRAERWRHGAIINHFVRGYWFAPAHPVTGPGLLEALRFGLRRLYELRLDVDYDRGGHLTGECGGRGPDGPTA